MSTFATISVPREYGYVVLVATSTYFVSFWHGIRSGVFRKKAGPGVAYPVPYAVQTSADKPLSKAEHLFNCAQRAHGNYLENLPIMLPALLVSGLEYPRVAAGLGAGWVLNRLIYALGYTRADKEKGSGRLAGSGFWLCQLGLWVLSGKVGYDLLR